MRLIDADALMESLYDELGEGEVLYRIPPDAVDSAPTVDAVVLPCNVGSTVYETDGIRIYPHQIKKLIFDAGHIAFDESAIDTSIFLTREEAEAALAERRGLT